MIKVHPCFVELIYYSEGVMMGWYPNDRLSES